MLVIVAAMERELRAMRLALPHHASEVDAAWLVTGVGQKRAVAALQRLLADATPEAIVSVGLAGALQPGLKGGDLVLCQRLSLLQRGATRLDPIACDSDLLHAARAALSEARTPHSAGECATAPRPAVSPEERERLAKATGAAVVDMEGYWVARAAAEKKIPFLAVRAVVDTFEQRIPALVCGLAGAPVFVQWLGASASALLMPWYIPSLIALGKSSRRAEEALRAFGEAFVAGSTHREQALQRDD